MDAAEIAEAGARTWIDASGRERTWASMTPAHLRNAAAHLRRHADERVTAAERVLQVVHSDAAEGAAEDLLASAEIGRDEALSTAAAMQAYADARESA